MSRDNSRVGYDAKNISFHLNQIRKSHLDAESYTSNTAGMLLRTVPKL